MKSFMKFLLTISFPLSSAFGGGSTSTGPAHLSSPFCVQRGGFETIVDKGGFGGSQSSFCRLKDDSIVNSFTLWNHFHNRAVQKAMVEFAKASWHEVKNAPVEKWAEINCETLGGNVVTVTEHLRPSTKHMLCQFDDRSAMEIWTLFTGPVRYNELGKSQ